MTQSAHNLNPAPAGEADPKTDLNTAPFLVWVTQVVLYRLWRTLAEITGIVLGLALIWFWTINHVLAEKRVDISFTELNASLWFAKAFDGNRADIGSMFLEWEPGTQNVVLRADDVVIRDRFRAELQSVERLEAAFDLDAAITGKAVVRDIRTVGGYVTWKRDKDGVMSAGLGTPDSVGRFAGVVMGGASPKDVPSRFSLGDIESVNISDAVIFIRDEQIGLDTVFQDANIALEAVEGGYRVAGGLNPSEASGGGKIGLSGVFSPDYEDVDMTLRIERFNPALAAPSAGALSGAAQFNMPFDGAVSVKSKRGTGLESVDMSLSGAGGHIKTADRRFDISDFNIRAAYVPEAERLDISDIRVDGPDVSAEGRASLKNFGSPAGGFFKDDMAFDVRLKSIRADMTPLFPEVFDLSRLTLKGNLRPDENSVLIERLEADFKDFAISASGGGKRSGTGKIDTIFATGTVQDQMTAANLLSLWPPAFADGARRWIVSNVKAGVIRDIEFAVDVDETDLERGSLDDEDILLNFSVSDAQAMVFSAMPHYKNARGVGRLTGQTFRFDAVGGTVSTLNVDTVSVLMPDLPTHGSDFTIAVKGHGRVDDMLRLIDYKPFEFSSQYGISPEDFAGTGDIELFVTRPMLVNFDQSRIKYETKGIFKDVKTPVTFGDYRLEKGNVVFKADKTGLSIDGPVNIGPWRADLSWHDPFGDDSLPTRYSVKGTVDRDVLDGLGLGLREYIDGPVLLDIEGTGQGMQISDARFTADLTPTTVTIGERWSKTADTPGSVSGKITGSDAGLSGEAVQARAPGLAIDGGFAFKPDYSLDHITLNRVAIDGVADMDMRVTPNEQGDRLRVEAKGRYFDASPMVAAAMNASETKDMAPIDLTADFDTLILSEQYVVSQARITADNDGTGYRAFDMQGTHKDKALRAILSDETEGRRHVEVKIPDAGALAASFFNTGALENGNVSLKADLPAVGEGGPVVGTLGVTDFTLSEAPVLAQILSLASLKGLTDTLGGTGLAFAEFDMPFAYEDGALSVRDVRASGPALGLTAEGEVDLDNKLFDLNGVLVPSYNANSVLGSIPVLGEIVVGKKGEGIFALNYTVQGPFSETRVAVNPLSALTPGFLRRIFDPNREAIPETGAETPGAEPKPDE